MTRAVLDRLDVHKTAWPSAKPGHVKVVSRGRRASFLTQRADGTIVKRRPRSEEEKERSSDLQKVRAVIASPDFWQAARAMPGNDCNAQRRPGRPSDYPTWVYLLIACTTAVTGSQRSAITLFADPVTWRYLRDYARQHAPTHFRFGKQDPPERHHLVYFQKKWKQTAWDKPAADAISAALGVARTHARLQGLVDPAQPLMYNTPDAGQWVAMDGTVYSPPSTSRPRRGKADERRIDPASGWHLKNGTAKVWGSKISFASVRSDDYHGRYIVDFEQVIGGTSKDRVGDEAAVSVTMAKRLKIALPGMRGVIIDSIVRGTHIEELSANDIQTVNYPHALSNPNRKTEGRHATGRIDKTAKVHVHEHSRPSGGTCQHDIHVTGANFQQVRFNATGKKVLIDLEVLTYERRPNKNSTRWYLTVKVPCQYGDQMVRIPLHHGRGPGSPLIPRGELLRFYSPNTPQFKALYGRRNDTESLHREEKRGLARMPAYGYRAQLLYVLGIVIGHNALTHAQALKREGKPNALDGTG